MFYQVEAAFKESKESLKHFSEAQEALKSQLGTVIATNHGLTEQVMQLSLLKHDLEEAISGRKKAEDNVAELHDRLEAFISSHAETSHKLQKATLILKV